MKHPLQGWATSKCCFCCELDKDLTCYIISVISIVLIGFLSLAILGFGRFSLIIISAVLFFMVHTTAGVLLLIGTCQDSVKLKTAYCWITFFAIFLIVFALVAFIFEATLYSDYISEDRKYYAVPAYIILVFYLIFLIFWDIYTPMLVFGNM